MKRRDFSLIAQWIKQGSRVLDLGCGDGSLVKTLEKKRGCQIQGVEIDPDLHLAAIKTGVPVMQLDIDKDLNLFADSSYDVVILSRTLQAVRRPHIALEQMLRIAPKAIVSMPNFGYWRNRLHLMSGHAPLSKDLPYQWYNSPNVHFGSLTDLESLFTHLNLHVVRCVPLTPSGGISAAPHATRNWSAGAALYELQA